MDAAHPLPDLVDDVEKLAGQARGDRARDAWSPREHPLALPAQPDAAAELYTPVSALSAERSCAARAAAVEQLRPEARQDAVATPVAPRKLWPKAQRAVRLPLAVWAVQLDGVAPQLAARKRLPASLPAVQPLPVARRAQAEPVRLQEPKQREAAVSAWRAPGAQPQAWPQQRALPDAPAEPQPQPLPSSG